jgi:hypothetical protein
MSVGAKRYIGGTIGFAFAAVWVTAGIGSALICIAAAGLGYAVVRLSEQGSLGAVVASKELVTRELRERRSRPAAARPTRKPARPASRSPQTRREPVREVVRKPVPAMTTAEQATYGW